MLSPSSSSERNHPSTSSSPSSSSSSFLPMHQLQQFVQGQPITGHHPPLDDPTAMLATSSSGHHHQPLFSPSSGREGGMANEGREESGGGGGEGAGAETLLASTFLLNGGDMAGGGRNSANGMATTTTTTKITPAISPVPRTEKEEEVEGTKEDGRDEEEEGRTDEEDDAKDEPQGRTVEGKDEEEEKVGRTAEDKEEGRIAEEEKEEGRRIGEGKDETDGRMVEEENSTITSNGSEQRTTDLILKQVAGFEREITRRMQNKNVKKMDEQEMNQLLLDHGLAGLPIRQHQQQQQQSALPFGASPPSAPPPPSLDHLRQSLITNNPLQQQPMPPAMYFQPQQPYAAAGMQFPAPGFPSANGPSYLAQMCPQDQYSMPQHSSSFMTGGGGPSGIPFYHQQQPYQFQQAGGAFSAVPHLPQAAQQSPSPPFVAQMLPPSLSDITPEMAAQLLAQLQQHNPALLQNLVSGQLPQPQQFGTDPNLQMNNTNSSVNSHRKISATLPSSAEQGNLAHMANGNGSSSSSSNFPLPAPPRAPVPVGPRCSIASKRTTVGTTSGTGRRLSSGNGTGMAKSEALPPAVQRQNSAEWTGSAAEKTEKDNGSNGSTKEPVWVMRESYLKRREREEQRKMREEEEQQQMEGTRRKEEPDEGAEDEEEETDKLLTNGGNVGDEGGGGMRGGGGGVEGRIRTTTSTDEADENGGGGGGGTGGKPSRKGSKKEVMIHEPAVLIEGVLFRARYLGSTQMSNDGRPTKSSRMAQAQEAVARVKAPEGELQPSTEIDLFISTEKIMVLNTDLQRISETDVRQDILMDHSLRSISYIADIGDLVVLMARRVPSQQEQQSPEGEEGATESVRKAPRVICHVFESDESAFIAQSIGQAFQVAYVEFLRANGIEDPNYLRDIDYQEVLNSQELLGEELELLARKETQKDVVVAKRSGEPLGVVVVESGWGSMLPTVVVANMAPGGAALRSNQLNIGDQIIGINGISLVGLPLSAAQQNIKNARSSTAVRLTVVSTPPVVEVRIRRPDTKYQLGFSVQNGVICSLLRGGIAERGGIRVGHRIIEINHQSVVAIPHDRIVNMLATATGEIHMKTMPTSMFRLLTGQEVPNYI